MKKHTKQRVYTKEILEEAVKKSFSFAQVLKNLNVIPAGGNYKTLHGNITKFNISTSHFTCKGWSKGKILGHKRPITDYLVKKYTGSDNLRRRLLKEGYLKRECYSCKLSTWLNNPIPLELEHIDGDHCNNELGNLTVLCPNCHTFTKTYRGKNIGKSTKYTSFEDV